METNIRLLFSWVVFANPEQNCKKKIMLEKNALMPCWCRQPLSCLFGAIDWLVIVLVTSFNDWTTHKCRVSHLSFPHCLFSGKNCVAVGYTGMVNQESNLSKGQSPSTNRYSPFPGNKPWLSLSWFLLTLFTRISELKSVEVNKSCHTQSAELQNQTMSSTKQWKSVKWSHLVLVNCYPGTGSKEGVVFNLQKIWRAKILSNEPGCYLLKIAEA